MTRRFRVTKGAQQDLNEIFLYWGRRASPHIADRLIDGITERFWLLGEYPNAGKSMDHIIRDVKCFPAGKYLIYYRVTRRGTDILHIFHAARDQKAALEKESR